MSKIGHNGPPLSEGWIARHRSVRDHWLVGHGIHVKPADPACKRCNTQGEAWEDLLMECRYAAGAVYNGGKKMELQRGQLVGAVSWLASRWNWTPKTVRRFLDQLENDGMIELISPGVQLGEQKGKQASVITICNYESYQSATMPEGQAKGRAEGEQGASKGQAEGNIYKEEQRNKETKEQGNKKEEREEDVAGATPPPLEALKAFEAYNELAQRVGLPIARSLTPQRRKAMAARMREHGGASSWQTVLANIERSAFLQGRNDREWIPPGLDWFLNTTNFTKVFEGVYGNGAHAHAKPKETEWERMSRLMGEPSRSSEEIEIIPPARRL